MPGLVARRIPAEATDGNMPRIPPPGPFLKWAGGKSQLLDPLSRYFRHNFKRYCEVFLGSAAVFFYLRQQQEFPATLIDTNPELINCYKVVRDKLNKLIPLLRWHESEHGKHRKQHYERIREQTPDDLDKVERAARLIYLNKTCYNGLYRVNKRGRFNVPMGSYKKPRVCNPASLEAASRSLKRAELFAADFSYVLDFAKSGDLIYLDPPYYADASGFTGYAVIPRWLKSFGADEHRRLLNVVKDLDKRGCIVVVSNSDTDYIKRIYKDFRQEPIKARRLINCDGSGRGHVTELVITNR